jgi:DTW domain-containing protein YfiP
MTLQDYRRLKQERLAAELPPRGLCYVCWRPEGFCYCSKIRKISPGLRFAILIHPIEEKRPIATGRMAHLCLEDSLLIEGEDFSLNDEVNALLAEPESHPVVLYPGPNSVDLSALSVPERRALFPAGKKPVVLVIDGTWNSARKTMWNSRNLQTLPSLRFTPPAPSRIRVRHQPEKHCYTTIEAIHHMIDLLTPSTGDRRHDNLLDVLDYMVGLQLSFAGEGKRRDEGPRKRVVLKTACAAVPAAPPRQSPPVP